LSEGAPELEPAGGSASAPRGPDPPTRSRRGAHIVERRPFCKRLSSVNRRFSSRASRFHMVTVGRRPKNPAPEIFGARKPVRPGEGGLSSGEPIPGQAAFGEFFRPRRAVAANFALRTMGDMGVRAAHDGVIKATAPTRSLARRPPSASEVAAPRAEVRLPDRRSGCSTSRIRPLRRVN
jgi:hypothetical protein